MKPVPTTLNRSQLRGLGLNSGQMRELFDQAQAQVAREGCTCGIKSISPYLASNADRQRRHYQVLVNHDLSCPLHPVSVERRLREERAYAERLTSRARAWLRRLGRRQVA